jgi:acyl-CoA reductase-like NAD-dependent aldehyde dehydrogenase
MTFESHNPATGELVGTYPEHDEAETNLRLQRAWDGWQRWSAPFGGVKASGIGRARRLGTDQSEAHLAGRLADIPCFWPNTTHTCTGEGK